MSRKTIHAFLAMILLLWSGGSLMAAEEAVNNPEIDAMEPNKVLIPKDIYDAYKQLNHMLSPVIKKDLANGSDEQLAKYHFELGAWIRNNWGLWRGSDLSAWFNLKGIYHPDDMSEIILRSYRRYLRDDLLEMDAIIAYYVRYWKIREKPLQVPCENGELIFGLHDSPEGGIERYYHIAQCSNPEKFIIYEYEKQDRIVRSPLNQYASSDIRSFPPLQPDFTA